MKNTIPLIVAVTLALIAVFTVSRMRGGTEIQSRDMVKVVSATRDLDAKERIKDGYVSPRFVQRSSLPAQAVTWDKVNIVIGQEVLRSVAKGDYILANDIGMNRSLSNLIREGEWAVPVTFSDNSLLEFLEPGDEISIWATYNSETVVKSADLSLPAQSVEQQATSVLFPCVKILDIGTGDGMMREEGVKNKTVIIALPPQQAGMLIAAQRNAELYPSLRNSNDNSAKNRLDAGVIDDSSFSSIRKGLTPVVLPKIPDNVNKK